MAEKYEKNYKLPTVNLFPAIVWSIPLYQRFHEFTGKGIMIAVCVVFVLAYWLICYVPLAAIAPAIASGIILTGLFWVFPDYIDNNIVRIIIKIVILAFIIMLEFTIAINATLPWLQSKSNAKTFPRIYR